MPRTRLHLPIPRRAAPATNRKTNARPATAPTTSPPPTETTRDTDTSAAPGTTTPPTRPRPRPLLRRLRRIALWTLCALLAAVLGTAVRVWWVARQDDRPSVDAILVLGASQYDGRPSPVLRARLEHALALYRENVAPRIITVGGNQPGDRFTEAGSGRRWLVDREVAPSSVLAVPVGSDTLQSIAAVATTMHRHHWRSLVIVTDPWHALRSRSMARAAGLDAATSPAREGPAVESRATQLEYIARETAAYLHWWLFRRSSGFGHGVI